MVAHHPADLGRRSVEGEEIVLEDLDPVEAGGRDGGELFRRSPLIETVAIEVFMSSRGEDVSHDHLNHRIAQRGERPLRPEVALEYL